MLHITERILTPQQHDLQQQALLPLVRPVFLDSLVCSLRPARTQTQTAVLSKQPAKGKGSRGGGGKKSSSSDNNGAFEWEHARQAVLESMRLALTVEPSRLWRQGVPDRCFMSLFLRLSCKMLELPETTKSTRQADLALRLISEPFHLALGMETEFSAAVFLLVRENRHLADFVAKLCRHLVEKHADSRLGAELVREIGRMDMPDINRYGVRCRRWWSLLMLDKITECGYSSGGKLQLLRLPLAGVGTECDACGLVGWVPKSEDISYQ